MYTSTQWLDAMMRNNGCPRLGTSLLSVNVGAMKSESTVDSSQDGLHSLHQHLNTLTHVMRDEAYSLYLMRVYPLGMGSRHNSRDLFMRFCEIAGHLSGLCSSLSRGSY